MQRRRSVQRLRARRLRRGKSSGATGSKLGVVTFAPSTFQSGVAAAGASVRLLTGAGAPILLAGVLVTISLVSAGSTVMTASPSAAVATDSSGIATFTGLTLTGTAGAYNFLFSAPGYVTIQTGSHQLTAGPAVASLSSANVPSGQINVQTLVVITLRDAQGNALTGPASGAVTVQVTGANPVPQTTIPYAAGGANPYSFTYTPTVAGTDTVTVKYATANLLGSPYTSVVATTSGGITVNSLRVGFNNNLVSPLLGTGPVPSGAGTWSTAEPLFRVAHGTRSKASLEGIIGMADDNNILLLCTIPGSRNNWTDVSGACLLYNDVEFRAEVDAYAGSTILESALKRRRLIWYGFDEPWIDTFCDSVTPYIVKQGCRYIKSMYPDALLACRLEPQYLRGNPVWHTGIMPDGVDALNLPVNYFDKLDYAWATYRGASRTPSKNLTPLQYFTQSVAGNLANGYGTFCAHNWVNLGDSDCWEAFGPGDTRLSRIHGDDSKTGQDGVIELCAVTPATNELWVESPARILEVAQAAAAQPLVPALMCYIHPGSGLLSATFTTLFQRADFVTKITQAVQAGEARSTTFSWRTPK